MDLSMYRLILYGAAFRAPSPKTTIITQPIKLNLNLTKSKTERYYQHTKFQVELCKSLDSPEPPFFLNPYLADKPDTVKNCLLSMIKGQHYVYNVVFEYVYDRCLETCDQKTMLVEFGRKRQPVSTKVLATTPFPADYLWIYAHVPQQLSNKLNSWVNGYFEVSVSQSKIQVHSDIGETKQVPCADRSKLFCKLGTQFDSDQFLIQEYVYANGPAPTDKNFTVEMYFKLNTRRLHPDVFMPDYFTTVKPRPWTGGMVQVFSSDGDSCYCYLAALKSSSQVFEAQLRWNTMNPLTLELSSEVFDSLIEFINNSHVTAATTSFKLAVDLLFASNKYDVKELQDKLLDLFYVQPFSAFDDTDALVELYLLLEVTRASECVFKRITGIVKLKASEIMSSPIFQHLEPVQKSLINCVIESFDVVLDAISLWRDNKHATCHADHYAMHQNRLEENARVQALHKRKPWQLCCDYLNYCNFKTGSNEPAGEKPEQLIKIVKVNNSGNEFQYFPKLVLETDQIS